MDISTGHVVLVSISFSDEEVEDFYVKKLRILIGKFGLKL